jgi:hypothetical protein
VTAGIGASAPEFTEPAPRTQQQAGGVLDELSNTAAAARHAVAALFELLTLEARRAGVALAWMLALGVGAGILGVTAWLGLVAALVLCAVAMGLAPIVALILLVALNLAGAAVAAWLCMRMSKDLLFPSSRRQLAAKASTLTPQP